MLWLLVLSLILDLTLEYTLTKAVKTGTVISVRSLRAHLSALIVLYTENKRFHFSVI